MPKVFNKRRGDAPREAVYIGRGSAYGNPFVIGADGNRAEVIAKFREWVSTQTQLLEQIKSELPGKDLVCYCKPAACHGDVLLMLANPELLEEERTLFTI